MNRSFCLLASPSPFFPRYRRGQKTANGCPPFEEARVTIIPLAAEPRFDHNPSLAEILGDGRAAYSKKLQQRAA
jgi:hypothetical protein